MSGMNGRDINEDEKRMRELGHRRQIRCQFIEASQEQYLHMMRCIIGRYGVLDWTVNIYSSLRIRKTFLMSISQISRINYNVNVNLELSTEYDEICLPGYKRTSQPLR